MLKEKLNYYQIFQEESPDFYHYDEIDIDENEFNIWVAKNFRKLKKINSFDVVVPGKKVIKDFEKLGYVDTESQCHYSAKAITLLNKEYEYWTGFIHTQDFVNPIITHSFNRYKCKIVDFSRREYKSNPSSSNDLFLPHVYYGVKIPFEFINRYRKDVLDDKSMNPLLFEWFHEQKLVNK